MTKFNNDIFKQLTEVMLMCDNLSQEIKTIEKKTERKISLKHEGIIISLNKRLDVLEKDNIQLKIDNAQLKKENIELKESNVTLKNDVDRLKKQLDKDSSNSSKPPSSDNKNIPNNREKSEKRTGRTIWSQRSFFV